MSGTTVSPPSAPAALRSPRHVRLWPSVLAALPPAELAHDQHHILRVYAWAMRLAPEAQADAELCGAAALLHDVVFISKDDAARASASERSATAAVALLDAAGYQGAQSDVITEAIRTCSWSRGLAPSGPVGRVLQDADRLDAIGVVGLMRTIACSQWMARADGASAFYHPAQPLADGERALDDRHFAIDHCYAKLLRLAAGMHLPSAQAEARIRHAALEAFLGQLAREVAPL